MGNLSDGGSREFQTGALFDRSLRPGEGIEPHSLFSLFGRCEALELRDLASLCSLVARDLFVISYFSS